MVRAVALAILLIAVAAVAPPAQAMYCTGSIPLVCKVVNPLLLRGRTAPDGVHLSWDAAFDGSVRGYEVYRIRAEGAIDAALEESVDESLGVMVYAGIESSYVDVPSELGTYIYYVIAQHSSVTSLPSNPFLTQWPRCDPLGGIDIDDLDPHVYSGCLLPLPIPGSSG
jgi:hypothetical protein